MINSILAKLNQSSRKSQSFKIINRRPIDYTFRELAFKLNIPEPTLYRWMQKGILKARMDYSTKQGIWLIELNDNDIELLLKLHQAAKNSWDSGKQIK